ncbi:ABC transporter substrate-binding protein [Myxococcaceae bacterium GXIMD 01537]
MSRLHRLLAALVALVAGATLAAEPPPARKLVTVGPAITETVFALGAGAQVVGMDDSSVPPEPAPQARKVGYQRALAAEGVLALGTQLVLASEEAGPPSVLQQLRGAGVDVVVVPGPPTVEATRARIRELARRLDRVERGEALVTAMDQDLARVAKRAQAIDAQRRPRVLVLFARGAGATMMAGEGTAADALVKLAGGVNAVTGVKGAKPLTAESIAEAAPDAVLVPRGSVEQFGGQEGLARLPGLASHKGWRLVSVEDGYFMGFGPHLGQVTEELADKLLPPPEPKRP